MRLPLDLTLPLICAQFLLDLRPDARQHALVDAGRLEGHFWLDTSACSSVSWSQRRRPSRPHRDWSKALFWRQRPCDKNVALLVSSGWWTLGQRGLIFARRCLELITCLRLCNPLWIFAALWFFDRSMSENSANSAVE